MRKITKYAKENRKKKTPAESRLFKLLLKWGIRFRTQRMYDFYIADFLIPERHLIIELDGQYHYTDTQLVYDEKRTKHIEKTFDVKIIRFDNAVVFKDPEKIKAAIISFPERSVEDFRSTYGTAKY